MMILARLETQKMRGRDDAVGPENSGSLNNILMVIIIQLEMQKMRGHDCHDDCW